MKCRTTKVFPTSETRVSTAPPDCQLGRTLQPLGSLLPPGRAARASDPDFPAPPQPRTAGPRSPSASVYGFFFHVAGGPGTTGHIHTHLLPEGRGGFPDVPPRPEAPLPQRCPSPARGAAACQAGSAPRPPPEPLSTRLHLSLKNTPPPAPQTGFVLLQPGGDITPPPGKVKVPAAPDPSTARGVPLSPEPAEQPGAEGGKPPHPPPLGSGAPAGTWDKQSAAGGEGCAARRRGAPHLPLNRPPAPPLRIPLPWRPLPPDPGAPRQRPPDPEPAAPQPAPVARRTPAPGRPRLTRHGTARPGPSPPRDDGMCSPRRAPGAGGAPSAAPPARGAESGCGAPGHPQHVPWHKAGL